VTSHQATSSSATRAYAWASVAMLWATNTLVFVILFLASRYVVLGEIRNHAMGVAMAAAAALSPEDLAQIHTLQDVGAPAFQRVQQHLDQAVRFNPDVRYIYTMRRSTVPFSAGTAFEYIVDQPARDRNRNGVMEEEERSEPPGQPYDASGFPAMLVAWDTPTADTDTSSDPPYPDLLSGYAPVRGADGQTVAIVGVDITAKTVQQKLKSLKLVMAVLWVVMGVLGQMVVHLYHGQRDSRDRTRLRNAELAAHNELLRRALIAGPSVSPPMDEAPEVVLDRYDILVAVKGRGDFRSFDLDHDRLGFILTELVAHPMGATLNRVAVDLLEERLTSSREGPLPILPYVDASRPLEALTLLLRLLGPLQSDCGQVAMMFGVLDFTAERMTYASTGCPPPLRKSASGEVVSLPGREGAQGCMEGTLAFQGTDLILLASPGALESADWSAQAQAHLSRAPSGYAPAWFTALPAIPTALFHIR
jgi:hypothetical protein